VVNADALDRWSLVHLMNGLGLGLLGLRPVLALGGAVVYEVGEYAHEWPRGSVLFGSKQAETLANVVTDLALYSGGYFVGRNYKKVEDSIAMGTAIMIGSALLTTAFAKQASLEPATAGMGALPTGVDPAEFAPPPGDFSWEGLGLVP